LTTSTTSKTLQVPPGKYAVGTKITVGNVQHTVTNVISTTELRIEESWEVRKRKPRKLTAHRERGHSWWPKAGVTPQHYECRRCGATKEPATRASESCDESIVRAVHDL
jgi:hypothetical protein